MAFDRWFAGKKVVMRNVINRVSSFSAAAAAQQKEKEKDELDFKDPVFFFFLLCSLFNCSSCNLFLSMQWETT